MGGFQPLSAPRVGAQGESKAVVRWDLMRPADDTKPDALLSRIKRLEQRLGTAERRLAVAVRGLDHFRNAERDLRESPRTRAFTDMVDVVASVTGVSAVHLISDRKRRTVV
jgi:hypothetical protein